MGWSNLLKIGCSLGNPNQWPRPVSSLIDEQKEICIAALEEELGSLHDSLIVIATGNTFGVLEGALPKVISGWQEAFWNKEHEETGCWTYEDPNSRNLYINCEHPGRAVRPPQSSWGSALGYIIHLARAMPRFAIDKIAP